MQKLIISFLICLNWYMIQAQSGVDTYPEEAVILKTETGNLMGTLITPISEESLPVVLIIAGSGPTDRDGNNPMMKNNSLRMLAEALYENNIASLRYDKRGVGASMVAGLRESDLRFEHYIRDAEQWLKYLQKQERFNEVIVIGHSEGSLIGMIAAGNMHADGFISISGPGEPANVTIRKQLGAQSPVALAMAEPILDSLELGFTVKNVNPMLFQLFRPSVQPYLISWFRYDPVEEIGKLTQPVIIIQGKKDIQVRSEDARKLKMGNDGAEIILIDGMNHIFKYVEGDRQENFATYNDPDLPAMQELVDAIVDFIQ